METGQDHAVGVPAVLARLAAEIRGKTREAAKRLLVSKVGNVRRGERFDDDVADAVFARLQRNSQVGRYASEPDLMASGRRARRLTGGGSVTLYRAAPEGCGIRPGDFAAGSAHEAGFYLHGGHVIQSARFKAEDIIQVDGSAGGGQEYVYLPDGYVPPVAVEYFPSFDAFFRVANGFGDNLQPLGVTAPEPAGDLETLAPSR